MIDLYSWTTPNGRKVSILLEELGVPYQVHPININQGDQKTPEFLKISPNNKIPAIVDHDNGMSLMESGAIMLYLADKYQKFMPKDAEKRWKTIEWLMWQMGGLGPMAGQTHHFAHFNPDKSEYAKDRYLNETKRLYSVLEKQLEGHDFIVDDYSIADMACWPWVSRYEWQQIDLDDFPNVRAWYQRIAARPAVQKGYHVPKVAGTIPAG
ncbi:Disulfide-bond oxidoreductase YfcG [Pseudovibrio axinellae]|uniref:Disulfide-bond oxidoreductase YfcG n=1 Tax=Pseudovibrio axinellae TaxID=989403 RepID=A0A165VPS6_9HYPH|nr:glutathione S-transferase N-terminal domain-containing protein [Pseudovibrio axinellae]KZL14866.1 Disulfide-bond oxidoreductase YfcG [Pseudovibrio axinellae]SER93880.1 GST-like protein [Pseudovibrio axinellae]